MDLPRNERWWAEQEFGNTQLGNEARTNRLVSVAAAVAAKGGGTITSVFAGDEAGREGGHRLVEKHGELHEALAESAAAACFKRADDLPFLVAPIDGASLTPVSKGWEGEFGPVGNSRTPSRGLNVINCIGVTPSGTPLGVLHQLYWTRPNKRRNVKRSARRRLDFEEKETLHWLETTEQVLAAKESAGYQGQLWFQADRGADFSEFLAWAALAPCWVTVRANGNRKVRMGETRAKLWQVVTATPACHRYTLDVPRSEDRHPRQASLEIRFREVDIELPSGDWRRTRIPMTAVLVKETTPGVSRKQAIEWMLLTNKPISTPHEAREVVKMYSLRWRIEECHKTWKSVCRVEDSQLKTAGAYAFWARILFSVSLRAERLKRLARETPDVPATTEFTLTELEVMRMRLKKAKGVKNPTLALAVEWVARIGGYIGKSSGGPPGAITIGRGLEFLEAAAWTLDALRSPT
jgi:hypothetical protein